MDVKNSNLDKCCLEIEAYKQITGTWVSYGDYMNKIRPNLTVEEYKNICDTAAVIDKNRKKRFKHGKAD